MTLLDVPLAWDPPRRERPREPGARRTFQPVRRRSVLTGDWERSWIRPMTWREKHELLAAARAWDRKHKLPGDRQGPIGSIGLELLEEICTLAVTCRGRVHPTLQWMQERLRRSRGTVVRCLAALSEVGLVEWVRRMTPAEGEVPRGQVVEQISNLYRLALPKALRKLVRRAPPPSDDAERRAAARARIDAAIREEGAERIDAAIERGRRRAEAARQAVAPSAEGESSDRSESGSNPTSYEVEDGVGLWPT